MQKSKEEMAKESLRLWAEKWQVTAPQVMANFLDGYDEGYKAASEEIKLLRSQLKIAVLALEEIKNDEEESSHEKAENALWSASSALKSVNALTLETIGE